MSINETLEQRGARYGEFCEVSSTTQALIEVIESGYNSELLDDSMKTALFMICNKIARIVNGDPNYIDNWHDIAGYATLVEQELNMTKRDGEGR